MTGTPIADLLERMLASDVPREIILEAVRSIERVHIASTGLSSGSQVESPDDALSRRRKYDREYKKKRRLKARLVSNGMSSGQSTGQVDTSCNLKGTSDSQSGIREVRKKNTASVNGRAEKVSRGTRINATESLSDEGLKFALECGMTEQRARDAWAEFIDYWNGVPGARGRKLDWLATWRNRVRELTGKGGKHERFGKTRAASTAGPRAFVQDAIVAGMASALSERPDSRLGNSGAGGWSSGAADNSHDSQITGAIEGTMQTNRRALAPASSGEECTEFRFGDAEGH